jgi:lipopolysaccharide biosynthesis regulator YciM
MMEIHVATADAAEGEGGVQRLTVAKPSGLGLARRPFGPAQPERRREIRCRGCGFAAVVTHPLWSCPTCSGGDWEIVRADVTAGDRAVVQQQMGDGRASNSAMLQP